MAGQNKKNLLIDVLLIVLGAVLIFNAAVIFFAQRVGLFRVEFGRSSQKLPPRWDDVQQLLALLEEEKRIFRENEAEQKKEGERLIQVAEQLDVEKARLTAERSEIETLRQEIAQLLKQRDEVEEARIAQVSKMYDSMKAAQVAEIFERMDDASVVDILRRMKMKNSAKVLGAMKPQRAGLLSELMRQVSAEGEPAENGLP